MRIPRALFRGRLPRSLTLVVASLAMVVPASAGAAEAYELRPYGTKCVSGQTDERQYTYTICHDAIKESYLRVHDPAGNQVSYTRMPGANDVAPAPDGSYVYVSGGGTYPLRRFIRQGARYVQDHAYRAPTFQHWGVTYRADGRQIATDGYGNLYVANGMWMVPAPHVVTKYAPDGRLLAKFGDFSNTWNVGTFYSLSGIAVSRDGAHIYVSEVHNSRVQRFDLRADGSYAYALSFGNSAATDPYRLGMCVPTMLAAPYDIAVDAWGDVWTSSTSCTYIQKFGKDGLFKFGSYAGNRGATMPGILPNGDQQRSHNLAIDARGNVIVGETSMVLVRQGAVPAWPALPGAPPLPPLPEPDPDPDPDPDPEPQPDPDPEPGPDLAAPVIADVTLPATTTFREIDVTTSATDDVGVSQMRLATDDGNWNAWQPFAATVRFPLRAGVGARGVYVQVRDAAGRESNVVYRRTTALANDPNPDPLPDPEPEPDPDPEPHPEPDPEPEPEPDPDPDPDPDVVAPTLTDVLVPAISATSQVDVRIVATDDVGVHQLRLATDDGNWGAWQPFAATVRFTLRAGVGYRGVYVQVRDGAGRESTTLYRRVTVTG